MRKYNISAPDRGIEGDIRQRIDNLNKPKGSLGRFEDIALQVCLAQQTLRPTLSCPCHLLFGGDHGIEREGVSVSPREVTWQQMVNFTHGGGGVNMFCRQHGFRLRIVDVGVDHDFAGISGITDRKIAYGTQDFLHTAAMSRKQMDRALSVGTEQVDDCHAMGCNIIGIGEMGIGNTSPSSVWMNVIGGVPIGECIGAGAGLDTESMSHKAKVLAGQMIMTMPYARTEAESKAKTVYRRMPLSASVSLAVQGLLPLGLYLWFVMPHGWQTVVFAPCFAMYLIYLLIWRRLRGYTGDCCGAMFLLVELSVYLAVVYVATNAQ